MDLPVLAKLTSKNQITLPKAVIADFPDSLYFDVTKENGRIVLTPVRLTRADSVRAKLSELGITWKLTWPGPSPGLVGLANHPEWPFRGWSSTPLSSSRPCCLGLGHFRGCGRSGRRVGSFRSSVAKPLRS